MIIITAIFHSSAFAGVTGTGGGAAAFLRAGAGARALSLSGAFTAYEDDSSCPYWNPAAIASFKYFGVSTMYSWLTAERKNSFLNIVFPTQAGSFALNILSFSVGDIEQRTDDTPFFTLFSYDDNVYFLTYANRVYENISLGVNVKMMHTSVNATGSAANALGASLDLGMLIKFGEYVNFGLVFQDIAARYLWSTGNDEKIPFLMRLGLLGKLLNGDLNLSIDAEENEFEGVAFKAGVEGTFVKILSLRAGTQYSASGGYASYSFGGGLKYSVSGVIFQLDYAMLLQGLVTAETNHKLSLNLYFKI